MDKTDTQLLSWHELPAEQLPAEHWFTPVEEPMNSEALAEVSWPIEESLIRRQARREGMLLERLGQDRYRLWDLQAQIRDRDWPFPVDLTANCEYVDSLAGIAYFLWGLSQTSGRKGL